MRIHLDTDFGGDPDDACALAFLLGSPEAEIVGITTNLDAECRRAGCVAHYLRLARRLDIPVVAGAAATLSNFDRYPSTADDLRYWPEPVIPVSSRPGAALDLLAKNVAEGATVIAIGPLTNLALLEIMRPGSLNNVPVVFMGGWLRAAAPGLPSWGPEMDWNVQCDRRAAMIVAAVANLTLVTLPATLAAHLRVSHIPRLRASGAVGELLARQSEQYAQDHHLSDLARRYAGLPGDLLNVHYDPVTCAVALGWSGAVIEHVLVNPIEKDGVLLFSPDDGGRSTRVVTGIDGEAFADLWLDRVERIDAARGE